MEVTWEVGSEAQSGFPGGFSPWKTKRNRSRKSSLLHPACFNLLGLGFQGGFQQRFLNPLFSEEQINRNEGITHTGGAPWQWVNSKVLMWDSPFYPPFGGPCFPGPHFPTTLGGQPSPWLWGWTMAPGSPFLRDRAPQCTPQGRVTPLQRHAGGFKPP